MNDYEPLSCEDADFGPGAIELGELFEAGVWLFVIALIFVAACAGFGFIGWLLWKAAQG